MARLFTLALTSLLFAFFLAPASLAAQDSHTKFRAEFDKAAKLGSKSKMDQLMKDQQGEGIYWILNTAELISNAPNDLLYERFDALRGSWNRCYDTKFPDKMEQFFAYADVKTKRDRFKLKQKFDKVNKAQFDGIAKKNPGALNLVADEYKALSDAFEAIGDKWMQGQCELGIAVALEETYHGKKTDFNRVANSYARFVAIREDLGVRDKSYRESVPRLKGLNALGFGSSGGATGPGGTGDDIPVGPKIAGDVLTVALEYAPLKKAQNGDRPTYYADMHHQTWPAVSLAAVGSSGRLPRVEDGPTVLREGSSKAMVDLDADGKGDLEWPTRGKLEVFELELGTGVSKRKWALLTEIGREQDFYQGQQMNLQMTDASLQLYFLPASAMKGEVAGVKVSIVDDNFDGIYGSPPQKWRNIGLSPEVDEPEFDSIFVGSEKMARPWSEHVNLGKAGWHKLESVNGGVQLKAQPVEFQSGTISLKAKGLKPDYFILKGLGPDLENTYIDIANGKKVEIPIGRWEFVWGHVHKGKKMQAMKAVMLPGKSMRVYDVREGDDVVVEIGAPYAFDFEYEKTSRGARVDGPTVHVVGVGGETYDRLYQAVPAPEASARKKGTKRAQASEKMKPVVSNDGIEKHGWAAMWKPLAVEITIPGTEIEVQLFEKKNKLFGKIESDWK